MKRALVSIFAALLLVGAAHGALLQNVNPGKTNVDLGNGYKMSFTLPTTVAAYDVKTDPGYSDILKFHYYNVYILPTGDKESFLTITLRVQSQLTSYFIPKAGREDLKIAGLGPSVTIPRTIDGYDGYVYYGYPEGNPATNTHEANGAAFNYYPGATLTETTAGGKYLEGIYEVNVDTGGAAMTDPRVIPVFQSILDSIHVSGVG